MKIETYIKNNFIKLIVQILFIATLLISVFSIEFSIEIMEDDGKSVNYVGILRGGSQQLVKQELAHNPNDDLIEELDSIIYQLKVHDVNNHFAIHEDEKLQKSLSNVEATWINLKEEIYNYRAGADSQKLYSLSEDYYTLTNSLVFETQAYVESKVDRLTSIRLKLFINIILIVIFNVYQFISKMRINSTNIKLTNIAYLDSLTGLSNRAHCNEVISKYNQMKSLPDLVCVYFDLNNLKITNDTLGHDAGDKLLKGFGKILKEASEPYGFVCRNGGDEFVAIFENCAEKNIEDYINFLNEKTRIFNLKDEEIQISFAVGFAFSNEISSNKINDLLSLADKRMYENKAEYKKKIMQESLVLKEA